MVFELRQSHYVEKVLNKFKHLKVNEVNTPFDLSLKLERIVDDPWLNSSMRVFWGILCI